MKKTTKELAEDYRNAFTDLANFEIRIREIDTDDITTSFILNIARGYADLKTECDRAWNAYWNS